MLWRILQINDQTFQFGQSCSFYISKVLDNDEYGYQRSYVCQELNSLAISSQFDQNYDRLCYY